MKDMGTPYIGDIGTRIKMTLKEDLSDQDGHQFNVKKPDATTYVWLTTLTEITANKEYTLHYDIVSGDFDQAGDYLIQALMTFSGTPQNYAVTKKITVHSLYD